MVKKAHMSNKSEPANTESASANTPDELANTELSSADGTNSDINIGNGNNDPEDNKPFKYTKVFIKDPYNNRDTILRMTKRQKGVYV